MIRDVARTPEVDYFDLAPTHTHQHTHDMQIIYQIHVLLCDYMKHQHTHTHYLQIIYEIRVLLCNYIKSTRTHQHIHTLFANYISNTCIIMQVH